MTQLRQAVAWATTLACAFDAQDVADMAGVDPVTAAKYMGRLVGQGVLVRVLPDRFAAGPGAAAWRAARPKTHEGGNAKAYRTAQAARDRLRSREWEAKRAGVAEVLTRHAMTPTDTDGQQAPGGDMDGQARPLAGMQTITYVACVMNVSERTVMRWLADGRLKAVKIAGTTRIPITELERLGLPRETLVALGGGE